MVRSFLLVGLLVTSAASAQSIKLKWTRQDSDTIRFNASQCAISEQVTWTSTITLGLCGGGELKLWSTELECADTPGVTDVRYDPVPQSQLAKLTGTFLVPYSGLPAFKYGDAGTVCGTEKADKPHRICGAVSVVSSTVGGMCTVQQAKSLTLVYDTLPPVSPTITEIAEQDSALLVKFSASSDTSVVHFDTRAQGIGAFSEKGQLATASGSSLRLAGLTNGTTYDIQGRAEDGAGNFSPASELVAATPRLTKGFWARYRDAGGGQAGGCQAVQGLPLLILGGLWLLRRKRNP